MLPASVLLVALLASGLAAPATASAAASQVRTLFLTEQIRPGSVRGPLLGPVQPQHMVAQPGEEEGFLLAMKVKRATRLEATIHSSSHEFIREWTQLLRVEWVQTRRSTTGTGVSPGRFADPLPQQAGEPGQPDKGKLRVRGNQWGAFAIVVSVPSSMAAGNYKGMVVVRDHTGAEVTRLRFTVRVVATKRKGGAADPAIPPHDRRNFKVLFNFNPAWYRRAAPAETAQDQYEQTYRTLWFLARHRAAPTHWQRAYPTADGTYGCSAADGYLKVFDEIPWWGDGKPGAVPVALMPNHAVARCSQGEFTITDERGTEGKFDDRLGDVVKSAWFIYRIADTWRKEGVQDHRTYFLNPFDEPSPGQNSGDVPRVNELVHDYAPGVKVLGTTWPMQKVNRKVCRMIRGKRECAMQRAQQHGNTNLRNGGKDDLDGWVVPYFRAYGFGVTRQQAKLGINRDREVHQRLAKIRKKGGEAWTYDLPLGTTKVPQLAIDGPATDARFMFWPLGRDGFSGWYIAVSNRWVDPNDPTKARNPWENPLSWVGQGRADEENPGPHGVISNGWGSLFYPGLRPEVGLTNPLAQPVSSLRLQRMRDGVEDANLMRQYRDRFGDAALRRKLRSVMGDWRAISALPAHETFPSYRNEGLALRMELARRQMLVELAK